MVAGQIVVCGWSGMWRSEMDHIVRQHSLGATEQQSTHRRRALPSTEGRESERARERGKGETHSWRDPLEPRACRTSTCSRTGPSRASSCPVAHVASSAPITTPEITTSVSVVSKVPQDSTQRDIPAATANPAWENEFPGLSHATTPRGVPQECGKSWGKSDVGWNEGVEVAS